MPQPFLNLLHRYAVHHHQAGTAVPLRYTVRVPALKEQAQISQCLKKLDTLITLHQREHIKPILEVKRVKRNE